MPDWPGAVPPAARYGVLAAHPGPLGFRGRVLPAAYVRALSLSAERLEQTYTRVADEGGRQRYDYAAPDFDFTCCLVYDESGLVVDYPGIARRAG